MPAGDRGQLGLPVLVGERLEDLVARTVEQSDKDSGDARLAVVLQPVTVAVEPDEITDGRAARLGWFGVGRGCDEGAVVVEVEVVVIVVGVVLEVVVVVVDAAVVEVVAAGVVAGADAALSNETWAAAG